MSNVPTRYAAQMLVYAVFLMCLEHPGVAQQSADPEFVPKVDRPAFREKHPKVLFDEAHHSFHTSGGGYKPFADLITNDGYRVTRNKASVTPKTLEGHDVLVIANALGAEKMADPRANEPAFTDDECDTIREWVKAGGSLLLIADHFPASSAAEALAMQFGIEMSKGQTGDPSNFENAGGPGNPGWLVFSRENQLLADHAITRGRDAAESLRRVTTFVGQSVKGPEGSIAFLKLANSAVEILPPDRKQVSAAGRAQVVALRFGKGRVVVLGEASVLTAQVIKPQGKTVRTGMDFPGSDNRQLALNTMHWLSGLLD